MATAWLEGKRWQDHFIYSEVADHLFFSKVFLMSRESEKGKVMEKQKTR